MPRTLSLAGSGCIVLGAGAGIGAATCRALSEADARVVCVDRDAGLAEAIAREVGGLSFAADVTVAAQVDAVFDDAARRLGCPLRGVADIVGMALTKPLTELDETTWDRQFDIVLRHAYLTLHRAGKALAQGGGSIVFVGSLSGNVSIAHQPAYGTAKAALHHLVRTAAHELGPKNIRVNAVAPGIVRTPRLLERLGDEHWRRFAAAIPLGRTSTPEEIATAMLFLISDWSSTISGAIVPVDGALGVVSGVPPFTT